MGPSEPAEPRRAGPRGAPHLPVRGVAAGDQGPDGGERVAGNPARPGEIPECGHHVLVAEHRIHAAGNLGQLPEEVAAAVVLQVLEEPSLRVAGFEVDGRVQRQFGRIGEVQAHPAVVARQRAGTGPEDLAGGHELVQHGRLVVGDAAGQDKRLPCRGRNGHAGELVDGRDDAVQAAERRLPAAARGPHVLPGGQEPAVGGGVHRLDFGAERGEGTAAQPAEDLGVAPFAHIGRRQKGRHNSGLERLLAGSIHAGTLNPGFFTAGCRAGRRDRRRRSVRAELSFHHAPVRGQPLQRRADDGDAQSQPRRGLGGGEGPVRAGVARDEVAEGVSDRLDEGQRHTHGQRHAEGIPEPGGILDRRKALDSADVDLDGTVGTLQGREVGGGVGLRRRAFGWQHLRGFG